MVPSPSPAIDPSETPRSTRRGKTAGSTPTIPSASPSTRTRVTASPDAPATPRTAAARAATSAGRAPRKPVPGAEREQQRGEEDPAHARAGPAPHGRRRLDLLVAQRGHRRDGRRPPTWDGGGDRRHGDADDEGDDDGPEGDDVADGRQPEA